MVILCTCVRPVYTNNNVILWEIVCISLNASTIECILFCWSIHLCHLKQSIDVLFLLWLFCFLTQYIHRCDRMMIWKKDNNSNRTNNDTAGYNIVVQQPELPLWKTAILLSFYFGHSRVRNVYSSLSFGVLLCRPFRFSFHRMPINYSIEHVLCVWVFQCTIHTHTQYIVDMALNFLAINFSSVCQNVPQLILWHNGNSAQNTYSLGKIDS